MDGPSGPVLVVSGDPTLRVLVTEALALEGYTAAVGTYADALDALGSRSPALVLLDVDGSGGPGFALALERRIGAAVPVVGLTNKRTGKGAAVETAVVLTMPSDLDDLVRLVRGFCHPS